MSIDSTVIILCIVAALGAYNDYRSLGRDIEKVQNETNPEEKNKELKKIALAAIFSLVIGFIFIYKEQIKSENKSPKIEKIDSKENDSGGRQTWSNIHDIYRKKKNDTIIHTPQIETVKEINTVNRNIEKQKTSISGIDTTLQVFSHSNSDQSRNDKNIQSLSIVERKPKDKKGLLILRIIQNTKEKHMTDFIIDYGMQRGIGNHSYDPSQEYPEQFLFDLDRGSHRLTLIHYNDTIYDGNIFIEEGKTHVKYVKHEYPYGEMAGRAIILNEQKIPCKVIITKGSLIVGELSIKDRKTEIDLPEGSYQCKIIPVDRNALSRTVTHYFRIYAGHKTELPPISD